MSLLFDLFAYSRSAVEAGQWWRLATASVVHLSPGHLAANLGAALLLLLVFRGRLRPGEAVRVVALAIVAIGTGIHWATRLDWYAGASGVLWAVAGYGAGRLAGDARGPATERRLASVVAIGLLVLALLDQQRTTSSIGEPLAPQAHLLGCGLGLMLAGIRALAGGRASERAQASAAGAGSAGCRPAGAQAMIRGLAPGRRRSTASRLRRTASRLGFTTSARRQ